MNILGISAFYHDSAATLVKNGEIVAAAQEERFTRIKHDPAWPEKAIAYVLAAGNLKAHELDYVVYHDDPFLTLDRYVRNMLYAGKDTEDLLAEGFERLFSQKLWVHKYIPGGAKVNFLVSQHHLSHAASAFYPSPFTESVILTLDGVGEWATLSLGVGKGNAIQLKEEIRYPHSLGLFYSALAYFCGFKVNSGEYKFMGLAPYGKPIYVDLILENLIDVKRDGSFCLNLDYFDFQYGRSMINEKKFAQLFNGSKRDFEARITRREMDIAASTQEIVEMIILRLAGYAKNKYGQNIDNLVLAGGVALNCVANGKLANVGIFKNIWIQPAAGDAGGSLGAALYAYYGFLGNKREPLCQDSQYGSYLGPKFSEAEIVATMNNLGANYDKVSLSELPLKVASILAHGKIVGFFQGRMEFGPRALGARSILADPRFPDMQTRLNLKIKFRESFRPFAPSVLWEDAAEYFDLSQESPYMLLTANVKRCKPFDLEKELGQEADMLAAVKVSRSDIPAVTHVDYSARVQTVTKERNHLYWEVIKAFKTLTGCSVLVNTSFNVRGEPIVCTPEDAYLCFMRSDMDVLVVENFILYKDKQPPLSTNLQKKIYTLD